jgi:xylono-1,5-lactonase
MTDWRIIPRQHHDRLGEGPLWSPATGCVLWVDIEGRALNRLTLADGQVERWPMPDRLCWVLERRARTDLIAGLGAGLAAITLSPFSLQPVTALDLGSDDVRLNDAKADSDGRIYAGSMAIDGQGDHGGLRLIGTDLSVQVLDQGYGVANGPAISPAGDWLYHTDSVRGVIYRFARDARTGALSDRQAFIRFPADWGSPDGMTVDVDGGLWVAHWDGGRISRFDPDGALVRAIPLPASRITSCTFGGPELDRMFVTSAREGREDEPHAGALFEVDAGTRGLPPERFGG